MEKDFNKWNKIKEVLEKRKPIFCNTREIWWCSVGSNIGTENSGKNDLFERPVLILRVYNINSVVVVPLTSNSKNDTFHFQLKHQGKDSWAILSQARTVSTKRLQRKLAGRIEKREYKKLMHTLFVLLGGREK